MCLRYKESNEKNEFIAADLIESVKPGVNCTGRVTAVLAYIFSHCHTSSTRLFAFDVNNG